MTTSPASRRAFLKLSGAFSALGAASPLALQLAATGSASAQTASDYKALVCIFMFGGNDSHNMFLPTDADSWSRYWAARNTGADPIALMPVGTAPVAVGATAPLTGRVVTTSSPERFGGVLPVSSAIANPVPAGTNASARTFAFHPTMASLVPLWSAGRLASVVNAAPLIQPTTKAQYQARSVPLPANLMSHNDQQSTWQAGAAEGARSGWGGRMADVMLSGNGLNSVFTGISLAGNAVFLSGQNAIQYQLSNNSQPAIRVNGATASTLFGSATAATQLRNIIRDSGSTSLIGQDQAGVVRRSMDVADTLNAAFLSTAATGVPAPSAHINPVSGASETNSLATQLQTVARMIAVQSMLGMRRQVFFVSIGGWDTHDFQNQTQSVLLSRVAHAMAYFDTVLASLNGQNMRNAVTTFTMSDFARTYTTNGDGTDHAWGGNHLVMGGAVNGGSVFGQFPTVGVDRTGFSNPDFAGNIGIPTTSVEQYAATMGKWFGVSDTVQDQIFPNLRNFARRDLGFMRSA